MSKLTDSILKEHSKKMAIAIANEIISSETKKEELIDLVVQNEKIIAQRASYALATASDINKKIYNNLKDQQKLLQLVKAKNVHNAVHRNALKALYNCKLEEEIEVELMEECYKILLHPKEKNAIRVYAIQIIAKIAKPYPELQRELKRFLSDFPQNQPPSIQATLRNLKLD